MSDVLSQAENWLDVKGQKRRWARFEKVALRVFSSRLGFSSGQIFRLGIFPGRSFASIYRKMSLMDLGNPKIKARSKNARRLSREEKTNLERFLLGKGLKKPSIEVAERFKVRQAVVREFRHKLGIKLTAKEARASEVFQNAQKPKLSILLEAQRQYKKKFWEQRRENLQREFQELERAGITGPLKVCKTCQTIWFATPVFFYRYVDGGGGPWRGWLWSYCRACNLPWRRKRTVA